jgi:DNA-binding GntR family transcriptional regulator
MTTAEYPSMSAGASVLPMRLDRGRQAAPQVFDHLRERILALDLKPGAVLSRVELMEQFGLSQTPIRDALLRLAEEGLVDIFPQHATLVSAIDLTHARQTQFLRRSIELEVVRTLALGADETVIAGLTANLARQHAMVDTEDFQSFWALDQSFHRAMYEAAGVPDLWRLVRSRSGHLERLRKLHLPTPGKTVKIHSDHSLIVSAIAAHDPDLAQRHLRDHLSGTLGLIDTIRDRYPGYFRD